jgi:hypothetical protein
MKRKILSGIAAVSIVAGIAHAGDLNLTDNSAKITYEAMQAITATGGTVSIPITGGFVYTPTQIPLGSLKNPVLNINLTNVKSVTANIPSGDAVMICEVNSSLDPVSDTPVLKYEGTTATGMTFVGYTADTYVTNNNTYAVFINTNGDYNCSLDDNASLLTSASGVNLFDVTPKDTSLNSSGITENVSLGTADTQESRDTASGSVVSFVNQYCAKVTTPFQQQIDPADKFLDFGSSTGVCSANSKTTDTIIIAYKYDGPTTAPYNAAPYVLTNGTIATKIVSTKQEPFDLANTTAVINNVQVDPNHIALDNNNTITLYQNVNLPVTNGVPVSVDGTTDYVAFTETINLAVTGKSVLTPTKYTVDTGFDFTDPNGFKIDMYKLQNVPAGQWTYKGSTLYTPYIAVDSSTQTVLRINNDSDVNATAYWTCYDDQGNIAQNFTVNAYGTNSPSIVPDGSASWIGSDILKAAQAVNPAFAQDGKMQCQVVIANGNGTASGVEIMTINGGRDRVIPFTNSND